MPWASFWASRPVSSGLPVIIFSLLAPNIPLCHLLRYAVSVTKSVTFLWQAPQYTVTWASLPGEVPEWDLSRGNPPLTVDPSKWGWKQQKANGRYTPSPPPENRGLGDYPRLVWNPRKVETRKMTCKYRNGVANELAALYPLLAEKDSQDADGRFAKGVLKLANKHTPYTHAVAKDFMGLTLRDWAGQVVRTYAALELGRQLLEAKEFGSIDHVLKWLEEEVEKTRIYIINKQGVKRSFKSQEWPPFSPWWDFSVELRRVGSIKDARLALVRNLIHGTDLEYFIPDGQGAESPVFIATGGIGQWAGHEVAQALLSQGNKKILLCDRCNKPFITSRAKQDKGRKHARTCSPRCRKAISRQAQVR